MPTQINTFPVKGTTLDGRSFQQTGHRLTLGTTVVTVEPLEFSGSSGSCWLTIGGLNVPEEHELALLDADERRALAAALLHGLPPTPDEDQPELALA